MHLRDPREHERRTVSSTEPADRPMSVEEIRATYAEYADWMARFDRADRFLTGRYRRRQFATAEGRVLDVACGTGVNFRYLPETVELVGVDISPEMLANARRRLDELGRDGTVREMDAQELDFPDDEFDTVVSSLSTCTFPDPIAALREMGRVCKPSGRILLLEHGESDFEPFARFQEWRADAHYAKMGCRWDQRPLELVEEAGLPVVRSDTALFGIVTMIEARPE